jgi:tRNA threonylcarbamoyladenosine biosynthesis protein TsaE
VRGLARGAGSADVVASPTFTISKLYKAGAFEIHHFDFYRLAEAGIVANELAEVTGDPRVVVVVEWGEVAQHVLPAKRLTITIQQTSGGARQIGLHMPKDMAYLAGAVR